jgi:hypothetical protein
MVPVQLQLTDMLIPSFSKTGILVFIARLPFQKQMGVKGNANRASWCIAGDQLLPVLPAIMAITS